MKNLPLLFLGIFFSLAFSWTGIVLTNQIQLGALQPTTSSLDPETGRPVDGEPLNPGLGAGLAKQGKQVYIELGCLYCHSQQVRRKGFGNDYERGWGDRQSVARDYIRQDRVLLGTSRTGPDLANVGVRIPDRDWHHAHLFAPRSIPSSSSSIMPPFEYLYEVREIGPDGGSPNAVPIDKSFLPGENYELIPTERAERLVDYLLSLRQDYDLPEAARISE